MNKTRRSALITGGSRGLGEVIAKRLAMDGFTVWINHLNDYNKAEAVKQSIESTGGTCHLLSFDVTDRNAVKNNISLMLEQTTPFVVVNNTGPSRIDMFDKMSYTAWRKVLDVILDGFFNITNSVISRMIKQGEGRIINIASTSGETATMDGSVHYSAAKGGIIGATKSLASEVARHNIMVNAVSPGYINTAEIAAMKNMFPLKEVLESIPLGRMATLEEVAHVVNFLANPETSYITGQIIGVNGGLYS